MTFELGDRAGRRRRQIWGRVVRVTFYLTVLAVFSISSYRMGLERSGRTVSTLEQAITDLTRKNAQLAAEMRGLASTAETANARAREFEDRYERDVPSGPARELAALVNEKLDAGLDPRRLAFVIGAAQNRRTCNDVAVTKRFVVKTDLYRGPNSAVSFADNTITITGDGSTARDASDKPEAWFDPAKPVTIRFTMIGGKKFDIAGKLPIHHSVIVGDAEHRFSFIEGDRGFVKVAGTRCRFP